MAALKNEPIIMLGDCREKLKHLADNSIDLIVTSPPYADSRKNSYGGIHPDQYVRVNSFLYLRKGNFMNKLDLGEIFQFVRDYLKLCGQEFWEFISGNINLYVEIVEPLGRMEK
jgi:DNA modification methylase